MKHLLTLVLVVSFVGIGISGFMLSGMGGNHENGCVASVIDGTLCPTNSADLAVHHISAFQMLTTTIVSLVSHWLLLLASLLLISVFAFLYTKNVLFKKLVCVREQLRKLESDFSYSRQKIIFWLSLFELSPSL